MSGREYRPPRDLDPGPDRPNKQHPDLRHGTRGEPTGLPHYTDGELTEIAETQAREDEALRSHRRPRWWQRWFGGRVFGPR